MNYGDVLQQVHSGMCKRTLVTIPNTLTERRLGQVAIGPVGPAVNWHWAYIFLCASIIHHLLTYMKRRQNMLHFSGMKIRNCRFFEWAPTFFSVGLGSPLLSLPAVSISMEQKTCCKESWQKLTPFLTDTLPLNRRGSSFSGAQFEMREIWNLQIFQKHCFCKGFQRNKTQRTSQAMHNHNFSSYRFFGTLIILVCFVHVRSHFWPLPFP